MKKIYILPFYSTLTMILSTTLVSANTPTFVASVTGSAPTTTAIEMGARASVYRYNQDNENIGSNQDNERDYGAMVKLNNEKNEGDFKMYAYASNATNTDITSVSTTNERVSMTRIIPVTLFWFFPSSVVETATIISFGNEKGQVKVTRPWWSFFAKGEFSEEDITGDIEARIKNIPNSKFTMEFSTSTKMTLLMKIRESFIFTSSSSVVLK